MSIYNYERLYHTALCTTLEILQLLDHQITLHVLVEIKTTATQVAMMATQMVASHS